MESQEDSIDIGKLKRLALGLTVCNELLVLVVITLILGIIGTNPAALEWATSFCIIPKQHSSPTPRGEAGWCAFRWPEYYFRDTF